MQLVTLIWLHKGAIVSVTWTAYHGRNYNRIGEIIFRESTNNGNSFWQHIYVSRHPWTEIQRSLRLIILLEENEIYFAWHDTGGPRRVHTPAGTYNVLATESDNGRTFSRVS